MPDSINARTDHEQLRWLADTYARTMDDRDAATLNSLFVPDGRLLITAEKTREFPAGEGLEKIIEYMASYDRTFYFVGNHISEIEGDRANGETYGIAYHYSDRDGGPAKIIENPIRYVDSYVRTDRGWLFRERAATILWTMTRDAG
jgi:hypothetical protein